MNHIKRITQHFLISVCLLLGSGYLVADTSGCSCKNSLPVLGIIENAKLKDLSDAPVKALIDTGATTTALDARNIRMHINRQGKRWVYYDFQHKETGKTVSAHQPVSRIAYIQTHKGPPVMRAVVKQHVAIGEISRLLDVSLIDRNKFPQQLLIGRNYLQGAALVNANEVYLMQEKK